ncbi:MAG TPA: hypothetical protein VHB98_01290, partial [Chloroflexota bacterium]|nr:hypothetical protein [Chloroflexota bacterium]
MSHECRDDPPSAEQTHTRREQSRRHGLQCRIDVVQGQLANAHEAIGGILCPCQGVTRGAELNDPGLGQRLRRAAQCRPIEHRARFLEGAAIQLENLLDHLFGAVRAIDLFVPRRSLYVAQDWENQGRIARNQCFRRRRYALNMHSGEPALVSSQIIVHTGGCQHHDLARQSPLDLAVYEVGEHNREMFLSRGQDEHGFRGAPRIRTTIDHHPGIKEEAAWRRRRPHGWRAASFSCR